MFADCEGCCNLFETEDGYECNRYGCDINRVFSCNEWEDEDDSYKHCDSCKYSNKCTGASCRYE